MTQMLVENTIHATTEDTVLNVLGETYDKFGFRGERTLIHDIVCLLDDKNHNTVRRRGEPSYAAHEIHNLLWSRYRDRLESVIATVELFEAINRSRELGWIANQVA